MIDQTTVPGKLDNIEGCVFDAYGTLFDVNAAAEACATDIGDDWEQLASTWRLKQLQYTWLRSLMGQHSDFWSITGDALDFALESLNMKNQALRDRLMELYSTLSAYPEVKTVLQALKDQGKKTAILSNGSPTMLDSAVENAGIGNLLDGVFSIEELGIYKPHPSVYELPVKAFGLPKERMSFQSSNGWDAHAAKAFGYKVVWINRFGQAAEKIPETPDIMIDSLHPLPDIVG